MISTGTEQKFTGVSKLRTRSSLVRSLQHCYLLYNTQHRKLVSLLASTRSVIKLSGWRQCCQTVSHQNLIGVTERGPGPASSDSIWSVCGSLGSRRHNFAPEIFHLFASYCHINELGKICKRLGSVVRTSHYREVFIFSVVGAICCESACARPRARRGQE